MFIDTYHPLLSIYCPPFIAHQNTVPVAMVVGYKYMYGMMILYAIAMAMGWLLVGYI